jgi:hypothetical protein
MRSPIGESTFCRSRWSFSQKSIKIMGLYGRVAQLGEHLLCKHAFISRKSLNRRLLIVQTPLLVGLLIGLRDIKDITDTVYGQVLENSRRNAATKLASIS